MTRQEWQPLTDGEYCGGRVKIAENGSEIYMEAIDAYGLRHPTEAFWGDDYRLCQLVEVPEPTNVPNQLLEAMAMTEELLRLTYIPDHNWGDEEYQLRDRIIQRHTAITAWLDQQGATDANT